MTTSIRWVLLAVAFVLAAASARAVSYSWGVEPGHVISGVQYSAGATPSDDSGGYYTITGVRLYRNGALVNQKYNFPGDWGLTYTTTENGVQTVDYRMEVDLSYWDYDQWGNWGEQYITDYSHYAIQIHAPPAQRSPTIAWRLNPATSPVGETYAVEAEAEDEDGNLITINLYREDFGPFAFELNEIGDGTPAGRRAWSGNTIYDGAPTVPMTHHYWATAYDSDGNASETIHWYVQIVGTRNPVYQGFYLTNPYINQVTDVVVGFSDPDHDLRSVTAWTSGDNPYSGANAWPGVPAITHAVHNHQNPGPFVDWVIFWTWGVDHTDRETWVFTGQSLSTSNRPVDPPILSSATTNIVLGQSVSLGTYARDVDSNLTLRYLWYRKRTGPGPDDFTAWTALQYSEYVNGVYDVALSYDWTPPEAGEYQVKTRVFDPYTEADSVTINVVVETPPDTTPPLPPTSLAAGQATLYSIPLTWTLSTSEDVTRYKLFWGPVGGSTTSFDIPINFVGYTVSGLNAGVNYQFVMRAYDGANNESTPSNTIQASTLTPDGDNDNDGLGNLWEQNNGFNPLSVPSGSLAESLSDPDGDGLTTLAEFKFGTDPRQFNSTTSSLGNTLPAGWTTLRQSSTATEAVGVSSGQLAVDKSGAATYSFPLWNSPGTAGMEPKLSLNYSSQAGNGLAGFGWSVSGVSAITRGPTSLLVDGYIDGMDFDNNDQFYLDGQRLILISGVHGTSGAEYRTENESFTRVVCYGTAGVGPATFKAWTKAGLIIEFGKDDATNNSAFNPIVAPVQGPGQPSAAPLVWSVSKISDTKGNYMTFEYYEREDVAGGNSDHRIKKINYTGGTASAPYAYVDFVYADRPDTSKVFVAGMKIQGKKRLRYIRNYVDAVMVREYELEHTSADYNVRSLLTGIIERGALEPDGATRKALPKLIFEYEGAGGGWSDPGSAWTPPFMLAQDGASPRGTGFVDLNGDGRADIVRYLVWNNGANSQRDAYLNTASGWQLANGGGAPDYRLPESPIALALAIDGQPDSGTRFIDFDGDGLVDVLRSYKSGVTLYSYAYRNTGSGWQDVSATWALPIEIARQGLGDIGRRFIDVNGDGRVDLIFNFATQGTFQKGAYLNTGSGWSSTSQTAWEPLQTTASEGKVDNGSRFLDLNGDGLPDQLTCYTDSTISARLAALNTGTGWSSNQSINATYAPWFLPWIGTNSQVTLGVEIVDLNGDGLADILQSFGSTTGAWLNKGNGWVADNSYNSPYELGNASYRPGAAFIDVNGDGINDLVWNRNGTTVGVRLGLGGGAWTGAVAPIYNIPHELAHDGVASTGTDIVDLNGDGMMDMAWNRNGTDTGARFNQAKRVNLLKKVTTGLGISASITYKTLSEIGSTVYTKSTGAPFGAPAGETSDYANISGPVLVVSQLQNDDGVGGQYPVNYTYGGLRAHRQRGSLGFESMTVTDGRTGIVSTTTFRQVYPFIGAPHTNITSSGGVNLKESITTYAEKTSYAGKVHFIFAADTTEISRDLNGAVLNTTSTYVPDPATNIDDYGNIKRLVVDSGGGYVKTTVSNFDNFIDPPSEGAPGRWHLGRLTTSTVTADGPAIAGHPDVPTSLTRKSSFEYYSDSGLLWKEIVEPDDGTPAGSNPQKLTSTYLYDSFGNKTQATVSGQGLTDRVVQSQFDARGRFAEWTRTYTEGGNYLQETFVTSQALGAITSATDANNLTAIWKLDGFGRKLQEDRPESDGVTRPERSDATATQRTKYTYRWCTAGAPGGAKYSIETETSGAPPSIVFYDAMGRSIYSFVVNGGIWIGPSQGGRIVGTRAWFDSYSRAYKSSLPFYYSGSINEPALGIASETTSFDLINRPLQIRTADDENGDSYTNFTYDGLRINAVNPKGQKTVSIKNSQGWPVSKTDNATTGIAVEKGETAYVYDPHGNLRKTKVRRENGDWIVTSLSYDSRGRKTVMDDPNMGHWEYRYNAAGELVWQKDAKNQIVTLTYDGMGRMKTRVENEGTTTWTYDTAPGKGKGKLHTVVAPTERGRAFSENYEYDAVGRGSKNTRNIGSESFTSLQTYDDYGRPSVATYPSGYKVRNLYNSYGFLREVRDARISGSTLLNDTPVGMLYWQADRYSIWGGIDGSQFGNGVSYDNLISGITGRVRGITSGGTGMAGLHVQNIGYNHDRLGNVTVRSDQPWDSLGAIITRNESFNYDGLNRLKSTTLNGQTVTLNYDALGNITSKSDVGTYAYNYAGRPNAVTGVSGGTLGTKSYVYDSNGNMSTRDGATLSWTTYNQAYLIASGGNSSQFWFDASRQRTVQENSNGQTTYYAGALYEKVTSPGGLVEYKHYIMTPLGRTAVRVERSDAKIETRWFHQDALGSVTAVTDEIGRVEVRFAFDPWGKRGPANSTYLRGFTDHEHLEHLGLIHMNGRIYDPVLGRFLSADPFVDDAGDSQSYNRYSYCNNDPLNHTDPSGYFKLKDALKIVAVVAVAFVSGGWAAAAWGKAFATAFGVSGAVGSGMAGGLAAGFASGFAGSLLNGGSIGDAFKAGVIGGAVGMVTGGILGKIGTIESLNSFERGLAHGTVHGGAAEATGGEFRHGFYSGFLNGSLDGRIETTFENSETMQYAAAAVVGGTGSVIGGGKFANGAVSGAFSYLFNQLGGEFSMFRRGGGGPHGLAGANLGAEIDMAVQGYADDLSSPKGNLLNAIATGPARGALNVVPIPGLGWLSRIAGKFFRAAENAVPQGTKVFRVWGDKAGAWGKSWTTVDPRTVPNFRNAAGLPKQNSGRFVTEGILENTQGVTTRGALRLHGNAGGLPEVVIPNPATQVRPINVQGLNPEF